MYLLNESSRKKALFIQILEVSNARSENNDHDFILTSISF